MPVSLGRKTVILNRREYVEAREVYALAKAPTARKQADGAISGGMGWRQGKAGTIERRTVRKWSADCRK